MTDRRTSKGWKYKAGVHHDIGEIYIETRVEPPCILPTSYDLANVPEYVSQRARRYGSRIDSLWCYRHGQFFSVIPLRYDLNPEGSIDRVFCQCPQCEIEGVDCCGAPISYYKG